MAIPASLHPVPFIPSGGERVYRLSRFEYLGALICACCTGIIGAFSVIAALWNIDGSFPYPLGYAIAFGIFWSIPTMYGIWLVLAYHRTKLVVTLQGVTQVGIWRAHTLAWTEVKSAHRRIRTLTGNLLLYGRSRKLKIDFDRVPLKERFVLFRFLRSVIDDEVQEDWDHFVSVIRNSAKQSLQAGLCCVGYGLCFAVACILGWDGGWGVAAMTFLGAVIWLVVAWQQRQAALATDWSMIQ